jgi:hypothetical protein
MCTYLTATTDVSGSGFASGEWFPLVAAVVSFDHPQDAPVDHALCIDFRTRDPRDVATRVCVELDAESARRLAETILATLDNDEVTALAP